jgi:hypothetical protein
MNDRGGGGVDREMLSLELVVYIDNSHSRAVRDYRVVVRDTKFRSTVREREGLIYITTPIAASC